MTANRTGAGGGSQRLSHREMRLVSGTALALLPAVFFVALLFVVDQTLDGTGHGVSALGTTGGWLLGLSGVVGLAALMLPTRGVGHAGRSALLSGQMVLMFVGLVLFIATA
ncbi:hypothetical protein [Streptomyces sp. NPDC047108]|uniref:hypothetical protein n=1 Tax=Streptomyces sp. NPDC047108 TaxID=3155025 RepID=UPI00340F4B70